MRARIIHTKSILPVRLALAGLCLLVAGIMAGAAASDWPMFGQNPRHTAQAAEQGPMNPSPEWVVTLPNPLTPALRSAVAATPVLDPSGDFAIVGVDDGHLCWVDLKNAAHAVQVRQDTRTPFRGTPLVLGTDKNDYTVCAANRDGRLYAYHVLAGVPLAPAVYPPAAQAPFGPLVASPMADPTGAFLFVASSDGHLYRITLATGVITTLLTSTGAFESTPALGTAIAPAVNISILAAPTTTTVAIADTDYPKFALGDQITLSEAGQPDYTGTITGMTAPAVGQSVVTVMPLIPAGFTLAAKITSAAVHQPLYLADTLGVISCLNVDDGQVRWSLSTPHGFLASPVVDDRGAAEYLFLGDRTGIFYSIDAYHGVTLATVPAVAGGYTTGALRANHFYAGCEGPGLLDIDLTNPAAPGAPITSTAVTAVIRNQPMIDINGDIFVAGENGAVFSVKSNNVNTLNWAWPGATGRGPAFRTTVIPQQTKTLLAVSSDGYFIYLSDKNVPPAPVTTLPAPAWPQFQHEETHTGAVSTVGEFFTAPTLLSGPGIDPTTQLRWTLPTGGAVAGTVASARVSERVRSSQLANPVAVGDTQLVFADDVTDQFVVGDPLIVGHDYLGPILKISDDKLTVTMTYPALDTHAAGDTVRVSQFRVAAMESTAVLSVSTVTPAIPPGSTLTAGDINVAVTDATGILPGGTIKITDAGDATLYEYVQVSQVTVNTLVLANPGVVRSYANGYIVLANVLTAGGINVPLVDATGVLPGGTVKITDANDNTRFEYAVVDHRLGNTLILTNGLTRSYSAGYTVLANLLNAGQTSIAIANPERFLPGDTVKISDLSDATKFEYVTVTQLQGSKLVLAAPVVGSYQQGYLLQAGFYWRPASGPRQAVWMSYIGSDDGLLRAVDPESGAVIWANDVQQYLGAVRGAPVVDQAYGRIYVTALTGRLFAFAQNGQFLWAYPQLSDTPLGTISTPAVLDDNGFVYFASDSGTVYKVTPGGVLAPQVADPTKTCTFTMSGPTAGNLAIYRSAIDNLPRVAVAARTGKVYLLDGDLLDKFVYPNSCAGVPPTVADLAAGPVVGREPDPNAAGQFLDILCLGDVAGTVHTFYEHKRGDGTLELLSRWTYATPGKRAFRTPAALHFDDVAQSNTIYIGDSAGTLFTLAGVVTPTVQSVNLDGGITSPLTIDAAGKVLAATNRGSVYCLAPASQWPGLTNFATQVVKVGVNNGQWVDKVNKAFDDTVPTNTLLGRLFPNFTAVTQEMQFGYCTADAPLTPAAYISLQNNGAVALCDAAGVVRATATYTLADGRSLLDGLDVLLTTTQLGGNTLRFTAYYRVADAYGNFTAAYTPLGFFTVNPAPATLYPFALAVDPTAGSSYTARVEKVMAYFTAPPADTALQVPGIQWIWNAASNGGQPRGLPIRSAPSLWMGDTVMVGSDDGAVYAIGPRGTLWTSAPQPDVRITQSYSPWSFFHRDARHQGSLELANAQEAGPYSPSLRWLAAHNNAHISSSPVVTDRTPDRQPRVYQGTDEGKLYAHDALSGAPVVTGSWDPSAGSITLPGQGMVRATPAVNTDGKLAVGAVDGTLYLVDTDGTIKWNSAAANPTLPRGSFLSSPIFASGPAGYLVFAATADELHGAGAYNNGDKNQLQGGVANVTLNAGDSLIYDMDPVNHKPFIVTRVRVYTKDAGQLFYEQNGTWNLLVTYTNAATPRYLTIDVNLMATRIKWVNNATITATVQGFEIYTAGAVKTLVAPAGLTYTGGAVPTDAQPITATTPVDATLVTSPQYIYRVRIKTLQLYDLQVQDTTGVWRTIKRVDKKTVAAGVQVADYPIDEIVIDRYVQAIRWRKVTDATDARPVNLYLFEVAARDFTGGGGRIVCYSGALNGVVLWEYPKKDDPALPPFVSSPALYGSLANGDATLVAATTGGQVLALAPDGTATQPPLLWRSDLFDAVAASPVVVQNPGGPDIFLGTTQGDMYLLHGSTGTPMAGWPVSGPAGISNTAAITGDGQAYLPVDSGKLFVAGLSARDYGSGTIAAGTANWAVTPTVSWTTDTRGAAYSRYIVLVGRLTPTFAATDGSEVLQFGLTNGTADYHISLSDKSILNFADSADINTKDLTGKWTNGRGIELTVLVDPTPLVGNQVQTRVSGYYRLPDAAGNYTGPFTQIYTSIYYSAVSVSGLRPYLQKNTDAGKTTNYPLAYDHATVYTGARPLSSDQPWAPQVTQLFDAGTTVRSSPVIDAQGHLFFGTDNGNLFCVDPEAGKTLWTYLPDRSLVATTLYQDIDAGTTALPVPSTVGFGVGDQVQITRPDGGRPEPLGVITNVVPPATIPPTTLTATAPVAGDAKRLVVASTSGILVGDSISIIAKYDPVTDTLQPLRVLGNVTKVVDGHTLEISNDIAQIDLNGDGIIAEDYPIDSQVFISRAFGYLDVSVGPGYQRNAGDIISSMRGTALPMLTSPAIGPAQLLYVAADDGVLYAIGPSDQSITPPVLPILPAHDASSLWNTFHANNQRTGFSALPGPITRLLRWYQDTGSTLESTPVLGYADDASPLGVLYAGTCDETDQYGVLRQRGALLAYDASSGRMRWRQDDDKKMGQLFSSPAIYATTRVNAQGQGVRNEYIAFGTTDMPDSTQVPLFGVEMKDGTIVIPGGKIDPNGPNVPANQYSLIEPIHTDQPVAVLLVDAINAANFIVGAEVYVTDSTGASFEYIGIISAIVAGPSGTGYWRILIDVASQHIVRAGHVIATSVISTKESQQGHVYCLDRGGHVSWKFPHEGAGLEDHIGTIQSSPVIDQLGNIYIGTDDGEVLALDLNGNLKWSYAVPALDATETTLQIVSAPALDTTGATLFVSVSAPDANRGYLLALDTQTQDDAQRLLWRLLLAGPATASPTVSTLGGATRVYIGSDNFNGFTGVFYSIDPDNVNASTHVPAYTSVSSWPGQNGAPSLPLGPFTSTAAAVPETSSTTYHVKTVANNIAAGTSDLVLKEGNGGLKVNMRVQVNWPTGSGSFHVTAQGTDQKTVTLDSATIPTTATTMTTDEQVVLVGSIDAKLYAFDESLNPLWFFPTTGPIRTSPAVTTEMKAAVSTPVAATGVLQNDLTAGGLFSGLGTTNYIVKIKSGDAEGVNPNTFTWTDDNWTTTHGPTAITANVAQPLSLGVTVTFGNAAGHKAGDSWTFAATSTGDRSYIAYFGSNNHKIYALSFYGNEYQMLWSRDIRNKVYASPIVGMKVAEGSRAILYQASTDHYIYAFGDQLGYNGSPINPDTGPPGPPPPTDDKPKPEDDPYKLKIPSRPRVSKTVELIDREPFIDLNGNGVWDPGEPRLDISGGTFQWLTTGPWAVNEPYIDVNGNGQYDNGEPFTDVNGNGVRDSFNEAGKVWLKFVITVQNSGRGIVDNVKVDDVMPGTLGDPATQPVPELSFIYPPTFNLLGRGDMSTLGHYTGPGPARDYKVDIDDAAADPNTFAWSWSDDGKDLTDATKVWNPGGAHVAITTAAQPLGAAGAYVRFISPTGHLGTEEWTFRAETYLAEVSTGAPWEIKWYQDALKNGFAFFPNQRDPMQSQSDYQRRLVFYAKVQEGKPDRDLTITTVKTGGTNVTTIPVDDASWLSPGLDVDIVNTAHPQVRTTVLTADTTDPNNQFFTVDPATPITVDAGAKVKLAVRLKVTSNANVMNSAMPDTNKETVKRPMGQDSYLYFQLYQHPIPHEDAGTLGRNQVTVTYQTYNRDVTMTPAPERAETRVDNAWSNTFEVRLYYNGWEMQDNTNGNMRLSTGGRNRMSFSPWNEIDPESGDPLLIPMTRSFRSMSSLSNAGSQMFSFKKTAQNIATSGIRMGLGATASLYSFSRNNGNVINNSFTPFAWRATIRQAWRQFSARPPQYSIAMSFLDRLIIANYVDNDANGATTLKVDNASRVKIGHNILIDNPDGIADMDTNVRQVNTNTNTITVSPAVNIKKFAIIRDEWSPDFVLTNPINVTGLDTNGNLSLGDMSSPGNIATSPTVTVTSLANFGVNANNPQYRFIVKPIDLRVPMTYETLGTATNDVNTGIVIPVSAPTLYKPLDSLYIYNLGAADDATAVVVSVDLPNSTITVTPVVSVVKNAVIYRTTPDWNGMLDAAPGYDFGKTPSAGTDWDGFRFDAYSEHHLSMGTDTLDRSIGPVLRNGESMDVHVTRHVPNHQPASVNGVLLTGAYATFPETLPPLANFLYDDINGNGQWDRGEPLYLQVGLTKYHLAPGAFDYRVFVDMNGNGIWDAGEPYYLVLPNSNPDFGSWAGPDTPRSMASFLGVAPQVAAQMNNTVVDLGRQQGGATYGLPDKMPSIANNGNTTLAGNTTDPGGSISASSPLATTDGTDLVTVAPRLEGLTTAFEMLRSGSPGVHYRADADLVEWRKLNELQPLRYTHIFDSDWRVLKSPAGLDYSFSRPFSLPLPSDLLHRQPTGTYTGIGTVRLVDAMNSANGSNDTTIMSERINETDISMYLPRPFSSSPPGIDYFRHTQLAGRNWTSYLTGSESWPVAAPLPQMRVDPLSTERDDLAVWVASNTPLLNDADPRNDFHTLLPTRLTDTNLWYRRAKHLITQPLLPVVQGATKTIALLPQYANLIRVDENPLKTNTITSDVLVIRKKAKDGGPSGLPVWCGWVTAIHNVPDPADNTKVLYTNVTAVDPWTNEDLPDAQWAAQDTIVEILSHPWVPVVAQEDMERIRQTMSDPVQPDGGPRPLRFSQPQVAMDGDDIWLTWVVSGVQRFSRMDPTLNKLAPSYQPASYIVYKRFNPRDPSAPTNALDPTHPLIWVGAPGDVPQLGEAPPLPNRTAPTLLPRVQAVPTNPGDPTWTGALLLYRAGTRDTSGLYFASASGVLPATTWKLDQPLQPLNWAFLAVDRPQVWADSVAGAAENPMHNLNMIVQGSRADGNADLYYARLGVSGTVAPSLTLQTLHLPEATTVEGTVTEYLQPSADNSTFLTGNALVWLLSFDPNNTSNLRLRVQVSAVKPDHTTVTTELTLGNWRDLPDNTQPAILPDARAEYVLEGTLDGKLLRVSFNPYRSVLRVMQTPYALTSVQVTGVPRLQRLTSSLSADINPMVCVERYRYKDENNNKVFGNANNLLTSPRVWLYWTRIHEDGLGPRIYARPYRQIPGANGRMDLRVESDITPTPGWNGTQVAAAVTGTDVTVNSTLGFSNGMLVNVGATVINEAVTVVDAITLRFSHTVTVAAGDAVQPVLTRYIPERMLPMEVLAGDGSIFITRQSGPDTASVLANSPEAGMWVLSTASRDLFPPYPDLGVENQPTRHDLFLQVINDPVPD